MVASRHLLQSELLGYQFDYKMQTPAYGSATAKFYPPPPPRPYRWLQKQYVANVSPVWRVDAKPYLMSVQMSGSWEADFCTDSFR